MKNRIIALLSLVTIALMPVVGHAAQAKAVGWGWIDNIDTDWASAVVPSNIQTNPCVDSYWAPFRWSTVETASGVFNWTLINHLVTRAIADGKTVSIAIKAGPAAPAWLYTEDPTAAFSSIASQNGADQTTCSTYKVNVPYNATSLTEWKALIVSLKSDLDANFPSTWQPVVKALMVGGMANQAVIMALPWQNAVNGIGTGTTSCNGSAASFQCCSQNDSAAWRTAGYTRLKLRNAMLSIAAQYVTTFGTTGPKLQLDLSPGNFPAIDDNGNSTSSGTGASDNQFVGLLKTDLIKAGYNNVVQYYNDGMGPTFIPTFIKQAFSSLAIGGQATGSEDDLMTQAVSNLGAGLYQYDTYGTNTTGLGNPKNGPAVCGYHYIANSAMSRIAP